MTLNLLNNIKSILHSPSAFGDPKICCSLILISRHLLYGCISQMFKHQYQARNGAKKLSQLEVQVEEASRCHPLSFTSASSDYKFVKIHLAHIYKNKLMCTISRTRETKPLILPGRCLYDSVFLIYRGTVSWSIVSKAHPVLEKDGKV